MLAKARFELRFVGLFHLRSPYAHAALLLEDRTTGPSEGQENVLT